MPSQASRKRANGSGYGHVTSFRTIYHVFFLFTPCKEIQKKNITVLNF